MNVMHIPDGYLSPQTCIVMTAAMVPFWVTFSRRVKNALKTRYVPYMALATAFSFIIMMFNIPIPNGTSAHAIGGALLAVTLGPMVACICISIALGVQALLFGDGGIWAFGANCLNMAVVLPFVSYFVYHLISGQSEMGSKKRWFAGFFAGYIGLTVTALCVALELGLQPLLFHTTEGVPLYSPFPLGVAVTAMLFSHLLIAGSVEGIVTSLAIGFFQKTDLTLMNPFENTISSSRIKKLRWSLAVLVLLTPLGLLTKGSAWGEWTMNELNDKLGFIPKGMTKFSDQWHPLIPDYSLTIVGTPMQNSLVYIFSALLGIAFIIALTFLFSKFAGKRI